MKAYPISELFVSPQGEGVYSGTMMQFIRLAGCTVGKRYPKEMYKFDLKPRSVGMSTMVNDDKLPIYTEECTTYDGRKFACDTDYRKKFAYTVADLSRQWSSGIEHACITGGEPLMHDITELVDALHAAGIKIHIETSGTVHLDKAITDAMLRHAVWVTVSPKQDVLTDMILRADEIKLLVDDGFDWGKVPKEVKQHGTVYIQPINFEHTVNPKNLKKCMELQQQYPHLRVCVQLHKIIEHYIGERVL